MIGIQRKRLADWFTNKIDFVVTLTGITVILVVKQMGYYHTIIDNLSTSVEFWLLFMGVIVLSIGIASVVCYRILFKWSKFVN